MLRSTTSRDSPGMYLDTSDATRMIAAALLNVAISPGTSSRIIWSAWAFKSAATVAASLSGKQPKPLTLNS